MTTTSPNPSPSEHTPIATVVSLPDAAPDADAAPAPPPAAAGPRPPPRRYYRGGFTSSICAVFRDPLKRPTDCCAVACCGVLASDRTRYLLTGERPPPLWLRTILCVAVPAAFLTAMDRFAVEMPADADADAEGEGDEEEATVKVAPPVLVVALVAYVVLCFVYNCMVSGFPEGSRGG